MLTETPSELRAGLIETLKVQTITCRLCYDWQDVMYYNVKHLSRSCNILDIIQPHVAGLQVWEATLSSASSSALSGIESPSCE